jgi:hypothetical protein
MINGIALRFSPAVAQRQFRDVRAMGGRGYWKAGSEMTLSFYSFVFNKKELVEGLNPAC